MSHGIKRDIMRVRVTKATHPTAWYVDQAGLEFNVVKSLASGWYDVLEDIFQDGEPRRHIRVDDCEVVSKNQPSSDAATDGWVEHDGKSCPFLIGTVVHRRTRGGDEFDEAVAGRSHEDGSCWKWSLGGMPISALDVMAYKRPARVPADELPPCIPDAAMREAHDFLKQVDEPGIQFGEDIARPVMRGPVQDALFEERLRDMSRGFARRWGEAFTRATAHPLELVFNDAVAQAASGKGNERHGNGADFLEQPWVSLTEGFGIGGPMFQASKKLRESMKFYHAKEYDRFEREVLGALNYAAMAVLHARKEKNNG